MIAFYNHFFRTKTRLLYPKTDWDDIGIWRRIRFIYHLIKVRWNNIQTERRYQNKICTHWNLSARRIYQLLPDQVPKGHHLKRIYFTMSPKSWCRLGRLKHESC